MTPVLRESTARTRELGAELRRVREDARYTGHELAMKLGWSPTKVSRMETGARNTSEVDAAIYAAFCGAAPEKLGHLLDLAAEQDTGYRLHPHGERLPDELRSLIALETTAQAITYYEPMVIPGLLQTEGYARALFHEGGYLSVDDIESRVRIRMERQRLLGLGQAPKIVFFVHENAVRLPMGGARVMHEQLLHLLLTCAAPPCRLRVVPVAAGTSGCGPFTWFSHQEHNPVIYVEHLTTSLFLEGRKDLVAYRHCLARLSELALNEGQSRELLAELASEFDRQEGDHDPRTRPGPDLA
ncbi:helix-turn-helix transcriptional regulator [Actinophytocola sp.]|uniref:helix-turn-helix domain-containing protein n=1 Tax=Actinophytocola sp. TaxID=1872138 RepID=UPI002D7FEACF|nr:helix-turn-helix transcriptional regulator [Actinophytocola sp.]HET9143015.1 helix-turn-helix transcriptional regulator [Actinophytocola sp.]